jgi:Protein of unknown function (DUF3224)
VSAFVEASSPVPPFPVKRILVSVVASFLVSVFVFAQTPRGSATQKEKAVTAHATGGFDVKVSPEALADKAADASLGRMTLTKQFHGDLDATSKGEMLTAATGVKGSGAYVAIERVTGTLGGRNGSFVLQHTGIMNRGTPELKIAVVPDSGTGQLTGLTGTMNIKIADGKHSYDFEYTLPDNP